MQREGKRGRPVPQPGGSIHGTGLNMRYPFTAKSKPMANPARQTTTHVKQRDRWEERTALRMRKKRYICASAGTETITRRKKGKSSTRVMGTTSIHGNHENMKTAKARMAFKNRSYKTYKLWDL